MTTLEKQIRKLPPHLQKEVEEYIDLLLKSRDQKSSSKLQLGWKGALRDLRSEYTSVDLQHKLLEWWGD